MRRLLDPALACLSIAAVVAAGASVRSARGAAPDIVVGTANDVDNADVSSVPALLADPGPDGISLREAINATNNDPGSHTISFATPFVIQLATALPELRGGHVTIQGPVTIRGGPPVVPTPFAAGFHLASSGNRLSSITIEGFFLVGVHLSPAPGPLPRGVTFADNTMDDLTIRGVQIGVDVGPFTDAECPLFAPCPTGNTYRNTTLVDSVIESSHFGIRLDLMDVGGDLLDGATIARNTIRLGTPAEPGPAAALQIDVAGWSVASRVANVTVADNTIETVQRGGDGAIFIGAGLQRGRQNTIEDVHVLRNRLDIERPDAPGPCCNGIMVSAGSDYFVYTESGFPDDNIVRRVEVADNQIAGPLLTGVRIQAGVDGGGSRNRAEAVSVRRNVITSSVLGMGVRVWAGQIGAGLTATGNSIEDVEIVDNVITTADGEPWADVDAQTDGGVVLIGGFNGGRESTISEVRMSGNRITTPHAGIRLIGGRGMAPDEASGNRIRCARISGNTVVGAPVAIFAKANVDAASGNAVTFVVPDGGSLQVPDVPATGPTLQDLVPTGCLAPP
jgi:hypothetical protein